MRFTLHINDGVKDWKQRILVPAPGEHNVSNCAAAAAIAHAAGVDNETIVIGLTNYTSVDKRMQFMTLPGGIQVVNDCYNANPASMAAALQTVSGFGADCRRIALLGDMLELGEDSVGACVIGLQTRPIRSFYVKIGDIQQIFPTNADAAQFYVKRDSSRIELKAFAENGIDSLVYSAEYNEANLNVYLQIGSHTIDLNETMFVKVMDIVITDNNSRVESDYFGCISLKPEY